MPTSPTHPHTPPSRPSRHCDEDGDGEITVAELGNVLSRAGLPKHRQTEMMNMLDVDNSGTLVRGPLI